MLVVTRGQVVLVDVAQPAWVVWADLTGLTQDMMSTRFDNSKQFVSILFLNQKLILFQI
jgi:hypothetical protein